MRSVALAVNAAAEHEAAVLRLRAVVPPEQFRAYLDLARTTPLTLSQVTERAVAGWTLADFERGYSAGELHNFLYGDAGRVAELRVQARGRVAARHLWRELVESWAVPLVAWLAGRLARRR